MCWSFEFHPSDLWVSETTMHRSWKDSSGQLSGMSESSNGDSSEVAPLETYLRNWSLVFLWKYICLPSFEGQQCFSCHRWRACSFPQFEISAPNVWGSSMLFLVSKSFRKWGLNRESWVVLLGCQIALSSKCCSRHWLMSLPIVEQTFHWRILNQLRVSID